MISCHFEAARRPTASCQRIIQNAFSAIANITAWERHSGEKLLPSLCRNSASTYAQPSGLVIALKVFCKMDDSARRQGHVLVRQHIAWRICSGILVPSDRTEKIQFIESLPVGIDVGFDAVHFLERRY